MQTCKLYVHKIWNMKCHSFETTYISSFVNKFSKTPFFLRKHSILNKLFRTESTLGIWKIYASLSFLVINKLVFSSCEVFPCILKNAISVTSQVEFLGQMDLKQNRGTKHSKSQAAIVNQKPLVLHIIQSSKFLNWAQTLNTLN